MTLLDTWIGHFELGRAYLRATNQFAAKADSEFDRCLKRRGEALSLFLDEEPTYGYFPMVYYYQGRVREGLKNEGFAECYSDLSRDPRESRKKTRCCQKSSAARALARTVFDCV